MLAQKSHDNLLKDIKLITESTDITVESFIAAMDETY
jgi:hypothetical protein